MEPLVDFSISLLAAGNPAPRDEWSQPRPWWETALPFVIFGVWLGLCGLATWFVARRLQRRGGASSAILVLSALVPLLIFAILYLGVSLASGATSLLEIVLGVTRFEPEGYALLMATIMVGVGVAWGSATKDKKTRERELQDSLNDLQ